MADRVVVLGGRRQVYPDRMTGQAVTRTEIAYAAWVPQSATMRGLEAVQVTVDPRVYVELPVVPGVYDVRVSLVQDRRSKRSIEHVQRAELVAPVDLGTELAGDDVVLVLGCSRYATYTGKDGRQHRGRSVFAVASSRLEDEEDSPALDGRGLAYARLLGEPALFEALASVVPAFCLLRRERRLDVASGQFTLDVVSLEPLAEAGELVAALGVRPAVVAEARPEPIGRRRRGGELSVEDAAV